MNKSQAFPIYTPSRDAAYIRGMVAVNFMGFLMSRAFILENTMPFGTAFFSAALLNRCMPIPTFLSAALGIISIAGLEASYKYMAMMGLSYIIMRVFFRKNPIGRHSASLVTFFAMLGTSALWLNPAGSWTPLDMIIIGFEALAGGILVYIFDYAFSVIMDLGRGRHVTSEEAICTAVAIAVTVKQHWCPADMAYCHKNHGYGCGNIDGRLYRRGCGGQRDRGAFGYNLGAYDHPGSGGCGGVLLCGAVVGGF